jgi:rubrerythrin
MGVFARTEDQNNIRKFLFSEEEYPMDLVYNAEEIFQMGIEIEKNGLAFYAAAAKFTKSPEVRKLCEELGSWEGKHVELFKTLKAHLPALAGHEPVYDPDNELELYLKAAADSHIFVGGKAINELVETAKTGLDILKIALTFEKDSVVLYTTMKSMVPERLGKNEIDKIIYEEIGHISIIHKNILMLKE